ncbi:MAG: 16S rRNA (guanine(966)-N(2))-methyltransferase RsmD [Deltaproteobacteria bacterium]|nr:16S rRNA (guanine(966)-N(2))-methyltransferase RsmD [Deltaproteobacteria bacterium]
MRIIAGTARGRRLSSPRTGTFDIRPTSDRAREAVFNILAGLVAGARVLDLFAGTGALGLEALSRGAKSALFVDSGQSAISLIRANIQLCGFSAQTLVVKRDLSRSLFFLQPLAPAGGFSLVFVDPPYKTRLAEKIIAQLAEGEMIRAGGTLVVESSSGDKLPESVSVFSLADQRVYGEAGFWFYEKMRETCRE